MTEGGAQSRGLPAVPAGPASSANSPCAQALATTPRIAQERLVQGQGAWQSAAPAGRCTHERTAGEGAAACCGVVGVRAAHRHAADVAWRTREVPWQRRCFSATAPVAAPACGRGGEIVTVGTPRRFRGSSKRAGISQERVSGRAGARRSSVGTAQAAPWSPARVNMRACMLSNGISCYRDTISRVCHSICPRVLLLVL